MTPPAAMETHARPTGEDKRKRKFQRNAREAVYVANTSSTSVVMSLFVRGSKAMMEEVSGETWQTFARVAGEIEFIGCSVSVTSASQSIHMWNRVKTEVKQIIVAIIPCEIVKYVTLNASGI